MDINEIVSSIADRCGYRGTTLNAQIFTEMQKVQKYELEGSLDLPEFLKVINETFTIPATRIFLKSGLDNSFLRPIDEAGMWYFDDSQEAEEQYVRILKGDYDELLNKWGAGTAEFPVAYAEDRKTFYFFPIPEAALTDLGRISYYKRAATPVADQTEAQNEWALYAADLLEARTLVRMAKRLRDPKLKDDALAEARAAHVRIFGEDTAQEMADRELIMGGED